MLLRVTDQLTHLSYGGIGAYDTYLVAHLKTHARACDEIDASTSHTGYVDTVDLAEL